MKLIIDTREHSIKDILQIPFESANLDVGDIQYRTDDDIPVCLIERKTIADLASSIKDGRAREQKARIKTLLDEHPACKVIYLFEKPIDRDKNYHIPHKTLYGSIVNTFVRDNFYVLHTQNVEETVIYIEKIYEKLIEHSSDGNATTNTNTGNAESNYCAALSTKKKENVTPKVCFANQIAQIPGLSINMGLSISETYASMKELIEAYNAIDDILTEDLPSQGRKRVKLSEEEQRIQMKKDLLKDIDLLDSKIGRKVGKKASGNVFAFLL